MAPSVRNVHFHRGISAVSSNAPATQCKSQLPQWPRNAAARWQRQVAECTFAMVILFFPKRQTVAAVVVKLPRWACDVARTSLRGSGCDAQHALSPRRECDFDNAGSFDCHGGAATLGLQRNRAMATASRKMHFRRGDIVFFETANGGGGQRQAATLGVRRRTDVNSEISPQRAACIFADARMRF